MQNKQNYNRCPAQGKMARTDRLSNWSIYHENDQFSEKLRQKHTRPEGVRPFGWLLRVIRVSETAGVPTAPYESFPSYWDCEPEEFNPISVQVHIWNQE